MDEFEAKVACRVDDTARSVGQLGQRNRSGKFSRRDAFPLKDLLAKHELRQYMSQHKTWCCCAFLKSHCQLVKGGSVNSEDRGIGDPGQAHCCVTFGSIGIQSWPPTKVGGMAVEVGGRKKAGEPPDRSGVRRPSGNHADFVCRTRWSL